MFGKLKKPKQVVKAETSPKKLRGYSVAPATTDSVQLGGMREPDIQAGGGCNTRQLAREPR